MASTLKNLSSFDPKTVPNGKGKKVAIVCSEWNDTITIPLLEGAITALTDHGVEEGDIEVHYVPGTYELPYGVQKCLENKTFDGAIALGCVIQGETPHFDFICDATANGLMQVGIKFSKPCIFGVITTLNMEQAKDRSGGIHGNKGIEAGITLLKMLNFAK